MEVSLMRTGPSIVVAGLSLLLTATSAAPHHAFSAEFDANRPVKLRGTNTRVDWINPHSWIHIDVRRADGTTESWMVERSSRHADQTRLDQDFAVPWYGDSR